MGASVVSALMAIAEASRIVRTRDISAGPPHAFYAAPECLGLRCGNGPPRQYRIQRRAQCPISRPRRVWKILDVAVIAHRSGAVEQKGVRGGRGAKLVCYPILSILVYREGEPRARAMLFHH